MVKMYQTKKHVYQNRGNLRRRQEEIEYWREHAGWFDDDARMGDYNSGVYDTYNGIGNDDSSGLVRGSKEDLVMTIFKVVAVVFVLGLSACLSRAILKKSSKETKKEGKRSESRSRSSSKRRSRSRSRSRRGDYDLMDEDDGKSRRSSRSKSRRRSSRSRSRARSRSKSRRSGSVARPKAKTPPAEPVLV